MTMTYKQFHEAWQEMPDKFFEYCEDHIDKRGVCGSCYIAVLIRKCQNQGQKDPKGRACEACMLSVYDQKRNICDRCFYEYSKILDNMGNRNFNLVRLLAYAVYVRERLRNINIREWYDFIQQRSGDSNNDNANDT